MKPYFKTLISIYYPDLCSACGNPLFRNEEVLCIPCMHKLPKTNFHIQPVNPVVKNFWGKVPVAGAASFYFFSKGEKVQRLIHGLKYKGKREIGIRIGQLYGHELKKYKPYSSADLIIPVPLHAARLRQRGYNQSECFAQGLSESMNIPFMKNLLVRRKKTSTQTRKHRFERFENVQNVFSIEEGKEISGRHVLLVDDVITTGSTLASCVETLLSQKRVDVSIASIASTSH